MLLELVMLRISDSPSIRQDRWSWTSHILNVRQRFYKWHACVYKDFMISMYAWGMVHWKGGNIPASKHALFKGLKLSLGTERPWYITPFSHHVVEAASCARFDMFESLGLVVILGGLALAQANSSSEIPLILSLFIIMPVLMMIFVRCRHEKTERLELHLFFCQTEVLSLIQQITSNFRLITDYWQQPTMVKAFGGKVQATNKAAMAALIRKIENGELLGFAKDLGKQWESKIPTNRLFRL